MNAALPCAHGKAAAAALADLAARFWQFQRHEFPLTAFIAGQPNDDPTMFREAPADAERRAATARTLRAELVHIDAAGLGTTDRATLRLLQRELDDLVESHAVGSALRPWLLPVGPEFLTVYFADLQSLGDARAARLYVARLATIPGFFADLRASLRAGRDRGYRWPKAVLTAWRAQLQATATGDASTWPWTGPFRRSSAAGDPGVRAAADEALRIVEKGLVPALQALAAFVDDTLLPAARDSVACTEDVDGAAYYAFWVRHFTTSPGLTPTAVHALGLAEVERLERELAAVAAQAGHGGDLAAYRHFLATDAQFVSPSAEALRERMEVVSKRIDRKLPGWFGHLPRMTYGVESIPEAMSARMPPAYAQPNPGDRRTSGIYWVSGLPAKCPSYLHVALALHEGWPGHLMHLALVQEMSDLPDFRRHNPTKYSVCLEGWALYCETLGIEMGLYETPHQHYGRLDMAMWRACRLVVDTGLHAMGWTRAQAIDYLAARLTLSRPTIEAEVDRYIAMPAQALAYQVGGLKFAELRRHAQARLGEAFDVRAFHDRLLSVGPVTLPVLEDVVDEWIAACNTPAATSPAA